MTTPSAEQLSLWIAIVGGIASFWWKFVHPKIVSPCWKFCKRLVTTLDQVDAMSKALGPNGGQSLSDRIVRIDERQQVTDARSVVTNDYLALILFEANSAGDNVRINDAFERAFGFAPEELLQRRWIRILHGEDRARYLAEWNFAVADCRAFDTTCRYVRRDGVVAHVHVTAEPRLSDADGKVLRWFGRIDILQIEQNGAKA